ncbi:hypothetical protein GCM10028801_37860 [Nocardioides maradonensis]
MLNCDVDRLRCLVGGWRENFVSTGSIIRPVALAMIRADLDEGHDVVLPQMLANEDERARFRAVAVEHSVGVGRDVDSSYREVAAAVQAAAATS